MGEFENSGDTAQNLPPNSMSLRGCLTRLEDEIVVRAAAIGCVLLATLMVACLPSNAGEGSRSRIREVLAEAKYSSSANGTLDAMLINKNPRTCDFFGYRLRCARTYLTLRERSTVKRATAKAVPQAIKVLSKAKYPPINRLTIVNAFRSEKDRDSDAMPILVLAPYPGFVPFAAYDGVISPLYNALNHSMEYGTEVSKPEQDKFDEMGNDWYIGRSIYDTKTENLREIVLSIDPSRFDALLHQDFDFRGHDLFGDFAESKLVAEGQKIIEFWESYVIFSRKADMRNCANPCSIAIELTSPHDKIRSIAYCSVTSVAGVPGSPENCYTVLTSDGKSSYLRVSVFLNAVNGLDGIGGDEIACDPASALGKADIDAIAQSVASDLGKVNANTANTAGPSYAIEISKKGANRTVLMATRFGLSAFFRDKTTYEISTTRVDLSVDEGHVVAAVALTAATSFTHDLNQDAYKLLQDAEAASMRNRIIQLLAPSLKCKTSRGT